MRKRADCRGGWDVPTEQRREQGAGEVSACGTPGMAVTAEIKTGKRRIIEYLLSPMARRSQQALRER